MPTSDATLAPATFADLPGWQSDDHLAALRAFLRSCAQVILREKSAPELVEACRAAEAMKRPTKASARAFFETRFVPHRVLHKKGHGFLTGYYEPVLEGSRTPEGRFKTPIYRRPPDLVNVVDETQRAAAKGLTHVRKTASGLVPYPTRAEIEQGALAGQGLELLYLADAVDAFFMHIQGSARIKLRDGSSVRVNYDGKNGHPYTSIGRYLMEKGLLAADRVSLQSLAKWLRADPERGKRVMWQNASFIFFRELGEGEEGALGALGVPLTPGRSLAVDTAYHRLGLPVYVSAPALKHATKEGGGFHRLMIAQDVGSAIKGPERGDIYFGSGDKAGRLAGVTKHPGNFFVLVPAAPQSAAEADERFPWQQIGQEIGQAINKAER